MSLLHRMFEARRPVQQVAGVPGPPPAYPLGNALDFIELIGKKKPWEVLAQYANRYGPLVAFWLLDQPVILVADPDLIEEVLVSEVDRYRKVDPVEALLPVLTQDAPFLARDQKEWEHFHGRGLLAQMAEPEGRAWLAAQVPVIRKEVARGCRTLAEEGEVDPVAKLRRITFDVFSQLAMGRRFGDEAFGNMMTMASYGDQRIKKKKMLSMSERVFRKAKSQFYSAIRRRVKLARHQPDGADLLRTAIRRMSAPGGVELGDSVLVHEVSNLYFGGLFSSTSTVVAALFALTHHPDEARLLIEEVERHCPEGADHGWTELQQCVRLDRAVRETLRRYPPVPLFLRNAIEVVTLGGKEINPAVPLWLSPWTQHHDPQHWEDPARWSPRRWTDVVIKENPYGSKWFWPFGRGMRTCSGEGFALLFIKVALATILAHSRPEVGAGQPFDEELFFGVASPQRLIAYFPAATPPDAAPHHESETERSPPS